MEKQRPAPEAPASDTSRPRRPRRGGLFGARGNRRVAPRRPLARDATPTAPHAADDTAPDATVQTPAVDPVLAAARRTRRRRLLALVAGALAVGGGGYAAQRLLLHSPYFAIAEVRFSPLRHARPERLLAATPGLVGRNLFSVDTSAVERAVLRDTWVERVRVRRVLPHSLFIDVDEREPALVVQLGRLYLADAAGHVFRRLGPDDDGVDGLPVFTGVALQDYAARPEEGRRLVAEALAAAAVWAREPGRPPLGEIHHDRALGFVCYTRAPAVGVRLGRWRDSEELSQRLLRFDRVWAHLASAGERPRLIYLDNHARPDRVTVKLAAAQKG